jgi:hypothetical protein
LEAAGVLLAAGVAAEPATPFPAGGLTDSASGDAPSSDPPHAAHIAAKPKMNATFDVDHRVADPRCILKPRRRVNGAKLATEAGAHKLKLQLKPTFFEYWLACDTERTSAKT